MRQNYIADSLTDFRSFRVRKSGDAVCVGETESLIIPGVQINFAARPKARAQIHIDGAGLSKIVVRRDTIRPLVRGAKTWLAKPNLSRLDMKGPALFFGIFQLFLSLSYFRFRCFKEAEGSILISGERMV